VCPTWSQQTRESIKAERSRAMSAASRAKPSWYQEPRDPNEHPKGKCSGCPLHWGHTGTCAIDFTDSKKTSRRAAIAATKAIQTKASTKKRKVSGKEESLPMASSPPNPVPSSPPNPHWDMNHPWTSSDEEEEEQEVTQVLEGSAMFPTIELFMTKARLETYTDDMKKHGWVDVQYLHETIKKLADFSKLVGFPMKKPGHKMKMLVALRKLVIE